MKLTGKIFEIGNLKDGSGRGVRLESDGDDFSIIGMTKKPHPGCDFCNHPLFAAMRCDICGKVHSIDDDEQMNPIDSAWQSFSALMRNYPLWPSTFSECECGRGMARGTGKCSLCIREELATQCGEELSYKADAALEEVSKVWGLIVKSVDNNQRG